MEDSYGGGKKAVESEDFEEEQVWEMMSSSARETRSNSNEEGRVSSAWRVNGTGGRAVRRQPSAAVDVPNCSKIVKKRSTKENEVCNDDAEEEEEEKAPPHEYLARRVEISRRIASSHSMCEGIGRTLKGRDLSNMRDAILTKTGYIE